MSHVADKLIEIAEGMEKFLQVKHENEHEISSPDIWDEIQEWLMNSEADLTDTPENYAKRFVKTNPHFELIDTVKPIKRIKLFKNAAKRATSAAYKNAAFFGLNPPTKKQRMRQRIITQRVEKLDTLDRLSHMIDSKLSQWHDDDYDCGKDW